MDKIKTLLEKLKEVTFLAEGNTAVLIGLGKELGLPLELRRMRIFDDTGDTDMGGVGIGAIAIQIQGPKSTSFEFVEGKWIFKPSRDSRAYYRAGDWWPILAYLRLEALVRQISTTYAGLNLTEHLSLTKALGLAEQLLGKSYHPNADAPVPRTVAMTLTEFLKACTSPHRFFETCFTLYDQGDAIKYELRFDNLPGAIKAMVEALDQRLKNLDIIWPA